MFAAALLTHVVRAGEFERRDDPATGRRAVVAGSFHPVPQSPVGPFAALKALPQGMTEAATVILSYSSSAARSASSKARVLSIRA